MRQTRDGFMSLVLVCSLLGLLLLLGWTGGQQVSTTRRTLDRSHQKFLSDAACRSAVEEVAALLENQLPVDPFMHSPVATGGKGLPADSGVLLSGLKQPDTTRKLLKEQGVTLSGVRYEASRWRVYVARDRERTLWMVAFGIIQFAVTTRVSTGGLAVDRNHWVRRYATVRREPGETALKLRILQDNLMVVSREK
jgi:hypothetical protein